MAKSENLIIRMLLENKDFLRELGVSQRQVKEFGGKMDSVLGIMGKAAGAIGLATSAYGAFNKMMQNSQSVGDAYNNSINALTTSVDTFFASMASGDFSAFNKGLDDVIKKAYAASAALDQLWNTNASFSYANSKYNAAIQEALTIIKDGNSTPEEIDAALASARQNLQSLRNASEMVQADTQDALRKIVAADTSLSADQVDLGMLEGVFMLDVNKYRGPIKARLERDFAEYTKIMDGIKANHRIRVQNGTTSFGTANYIDTYDYEAIARESAGYREAYKESIIYHTALQAWNDEKLKSNMELMQSINDTNKQIEQTEKTINRAAQSGAGAVVRSAAAQDEKTPVGAINILNAKITELKENMNSADTFQLAGMFAAQIREAEKELKTFTEAMGLYQTKGGELDGYGIQAPTGLQEMLDQRNDVEAYTDSIGQMQSAMSSLFSALNNGQPTLKDFIGLFASILGIFGGPTGMLAGTFLTGIGGLIQSNNAAPRAIVRGSDIHLALANYNKSMM